MFLLHLATHWGIKRKITFLEASVVCLLSAWRAWLVLHALPLDQEVTHKLSIFILNSFKDRLCTRTEGDTRSKHSDLTSRPLSWEMWNLPPKNGQDSSADLAPEGVPTVQHPMDVSLATVHIMTVRQMYIMCAFCPPLVGGSEVRIHEVQAGHKE